MIMFQLFTLSLQSLVEGDKCALFRQGIDTESKRERQRERETERENQ
jgi:hypothetical protein